MNTSKHKYRIQKGNCTSCNKYDFSTMEPSQIWNNQEFFLLKEGSKLDECEINDTNDFDKSDDATVIMDEKEWNLYGEKFNFENI